MPFALLSSEFRDLGRAENVCFGFVGWRGILVCGVVRDMYVVCEEWQLVSFERTRRNFQQMRAILLDSAGDDVENQPRPSKPSTYADVILTNFRPTRVARSVNVAAEHPDYAH